MKRQYVDSLREGARVEDAFLIQSKTVGRTKSGVPFLKLRLSDKTGAIDCVKWEATEGEIAKSGEGEFIFVHGAARIYNGDVQLTIDSFHKAEAVDPVDFLPTCERDQDEMMVELASLLHQVHDPHLTALLASFFNDCDFAERFKQAPAAKSAHHAYLGGLLEHTLNVIRTCAALADLYPQVNRDLLIAAAALHDIGKTAEFDWSRAIIYSESGQLVGHLVGGAMMVRDAAAKIEDFDELMSLALQHMILAHHGSREYGSPIEPKSIEALMLHQADDLDAKAAMVEQAIKEHERAGDSGLFTKKHYFLDRPIFKGIPGRQQPAAPEPGEEFNTDLFAADIDPFADD